ncbi:STAS domain-containing protein [Nonomuraea sp. NN258]|uniref:STAS domain-containing protein n=1 Tax=Nonomuraea antri TaxID=2730852 RepID=UPI001568F059|nr:STAS domain-containing protein [Nonomuraea antri]NRQ38772.1 STAS domain-containing protein [Nonomuraea antri]
MLVTLSGELDSTNDLDLESFVDGLLRPNQALILDLGGLTFMDGRGLSALLRLSGVVRRKGGALHLANVSDLPARLLQLTGIWDALNIHTSVEAAIAQTLHGYPAPS